MQDVCNLDSFSEMPGSDLGMGEGPGRLEHP